MLEVTTAHPGSFMELAAGIEVIAPPTPAGLLVSNQPPAHAKDTTLSVYLHGELQDEAGFDIAIFHAGNLRLPSRNNPRRTQPCRTWIAEKGEWRDSTLSIWLNKGENRILGLITSNTDTVSAMHAGECMSTRRPFL